MWCVVGCVPLIRELQQNKLYSRVGVVDNNVQIQPSANLYPRYAQLEYFWDVRCSRIEKNVRANRKHKNQDEEIGVLKTIVKWHHFLFWLICFLARNKFMRRLISANDHRRSSTKGSSKLLRLLSPILEIHQSFANNISTGIQNLLKKNFITREASHSFPFVVGAQDDWIYD